MLQGKFLNRHKFSSFVVFFHTAIPEFNPTLVFPRYNIKTRWQTDIILTTHMCSKPSIILQSVFSRLLAAGIEFDDEIACNVCFALDGEDGNEMIFCDACDVCVHQACYGVQSIPEGDWLCRTCATGINKSSSSLIIGVLKYLVIIAVV